MTPHMPPTAFSLDEALAALRGERAPANIMTVNDGETWDVELESAYAHGFILVVLDAEGTPIRAYRKEQAKAAGA